MAGAQLQPLFVQLRFKSLKLTTNAALQRHFGSPFVFREEDPSRQVSPGLGDPGGWDNPMQPRGFGVVLILLEKHGGGWQKGWNTPCWAHNSFRQPTLGTQWLQHPPASPPLLAPAPQPTIALSLPFAFQITFEISKPEESQIPIWIILGSTLGGLLLLALLVLVLWKVSSALGGGLC